MSSIFWGEHYINPVFYIHYFNVEICHLETSRLSAIGVLNSSNNISVLLQLKLTEPRNPLKQESF
jgi:hypothetical protein